MSIITLRRTPSPDGETLRVPIPLGGGIGAEVEFLAFPLLDDGKEHVALGFGDWRSQAAPLVRVHSECLTGDLFDSLRCDCGPQLAQAKRVLAAQGGLLIYLRQEGRGIGLHNKLRCYLLQLEGLDTFEANRRLGFPDDLRGFAVAGEMLRALGKSSVRLLTNNPSKVAELESTGVRVVERVPTGVFHNSHNANYLRAKRRSHAHALELPQEEKT